MARWTRECLQQWPAAVGVGAGVGVNANLANAQWQRRVA